MKPKTEGSLRPRTELVRVVPSIFLCVSLFKYFKHKQGWFLPSGVLSGSRGLLIFSARFILISLLGKWAASVHPRAIFILQLVLTRAKIKVSGSQLVGFGIKNLSEAGWFPVSQGNPTAFLAVVHLQVWTLLLLCCCCCSSWSSLQSPFRWNLACRCVCFGLYNVYHWFGPFSQL